MYHSVLYNNKNQKPPSHFPHFPLCYTFCPFKFFQCVKTSKGYIETAALCKYLWCNISMWIDFPPNPSIITGISWKPTSRWRLRALGSSDRSGVSPSHSKYLFFFWLGAAQLWGHFMCQPLRSHSGPTSKPTSAHCFCDVAAGPKNAQTEKCDVGQITAVVPLKKSNSYGKAMKPWLRTEPSICSGCPRGAEWTLGNVK